MAKTLLVFSMLLQIFLSQPILGQNKDCRLSADDLMHLIRASDKTVNDILLHHCFVADKSVKNGAKANYTRDYRADGNLNHDLITIVTSGMVTIITSSASAYNLYKSALEKKGFKFARKDEYGSRYVYSNYVVYTNTNNDKKGVTDYIFMLDKE